MTDKMRSELGVAQHSYRTVLGVISLTFILLTVLSGCATAGTAASTTLASPTLDVSSQLLGKTINITTGGTYTGSWVSSDPSLPAVQVTTDEPVVIENSVVSGPGDLIFISGRTGANVTVRNVTGTGLDPMVAGVERGPFIRAYTVNSLVVENCTMTGTSYGILVANASPTTLTILNNVASELEDRASDGAGGFQTSRPNLGHFIQLGWLYAANGAEVAWNQLIQTIGQSSTEDAINIYLSQGTSGHPIWVHDNYMEGYSSPAKPTYSGNGIIADGDVTGNTAYILLQANEMVHAEGGGVAIANGHDVTAQGNRVVSCGKDSLGNTYAEAGTTAITLWNYYNASGFYNNTITTTAGGMVSLNLIGKLAATDINATSIDATDTITNNSFTDPCLTLGVLNTTAEDDERAFWANKLQTNAILLGDQN